MYWRLSQGVESLFQPLVWNHFSDPWGWKHFSVPGTETVSKWFHPRDGKAASLFYSKSSNIHPPLTGITQGVKLADELGCHLLYEKNIPRFKFPLRQIFGGGGDLNPGPSDYWTGALVNWSIEAWLKSWWSKKLFMLQSRQIKKKIMRGDAILARMVSPRSKVTRLIRPAL